MNRVLQYYEDIDYPLQLYMFPEGTDMYALSIKRSNEHAEKFNLAKYKNVLHPRVTGFTHLVQRLREKSVDFIHDITVGYPVNLCYGEMDLVRGNLPKEIHVYMQKYPISELPEDAEGIGQWCQDRWREKEARLDNLYSENKFPDNERIADSKIETTARRTNYLVLLYWTAFLFLCFYGFWAWSLFRWITLFGIIFFSYKSVQGGMDKLQLDRHFNQVKRE